MRDENKNSDAAWGCKAIADVLGKSPRATYHLLEKGMLNGVVQKIGSQYVGSKKRIRRHIFGEE
jgi:hypothetical protein